MVKPGFAFFLDNYRRKGGNRMKKNISQFLVGVSISLVLSTYASSLTLYDDFSGTFIDKTKWMETEWVREIDSNHRLSLVQASPSPTAIDGYPYNNNNNLGFAYPDSVNSMQADVTLLQNTVINNGHTRARLMGRFYNDGTPGGGMIGDIQAEISLRMEPTGLVANWYVNKNINFDGTNSTKLKSGNFTTPINIGTTYTLSIAYDGAQTFTFKIGSETVTAGPSGIPARVSSASSPAKVLSTRVQVDDATSSGYVSAAFDNVFKNGIPYDDFSSSVIDPTKWISYEFVRETSGGKLWSSVRSSSGSTSSNYNRLEFVNPSSINVVQAKVTPLTYQNTQGADIVARIGGIFYNNGTPGSGYQGEVAADVRIGGTGANPVASWIIWTYTDVDGNNTSIVTSGNFTQPVSLNNTYTLSLGWDGSGFVFKFGDEIAYYTPITAIQSPHVPWKELGIRVLNPAGKEATIEVTFDEAMTGTSLTPEIDVNPGSIDFGNVPGGSTSDQTIAVKNVGLVNLTLETIGSPATPFSITGGTCTNNQVLTPSGNCTLIIRFAPTASGVFSSSFNIPSNASSEPSVTVNLTGGSGPDLTGEWQSLTQTCKTSKTAQKCTVNGTFVVKNIGNSNATTSSVKFYLSDNNSYDEADTFLKQVSTGKLKVNASKSIKLTSKLPGNALGKYVIAVINADNTAVEANKGNDIIVYGPIP
jgi:hypothetical protein